MLHRNCRKNCLILTKGPLVLIAGTTVNGNITKISSCGSSGVPQLTDSVSQVISTFTLTSRHGSVGFSQIHILQALPRVAL
mmetsp:Transcript_29254/g.95659  ORF Transcript_29254/g.95659 Transcript_29254/m.95659 type:complete len:81 (-) Transcript_29254:385-627(-)